MHTHTRTHTRTYTNPTQPHTRAQGADAIGGGALAPRMGLSMGTRILLQYLKGVERALQAAPPDNLTVILHVKEHQLDQVCYAKRVPHEDTALTTIVMVLQP